MNYIAALQDFLLEYGRDAHRETVELRTEQPLAGYSLMRTGGTADAIVFPTGTRSALAVISFLHEKNIRHYYLGKGTDTLFLGSRYQGIIVSAERMNTIRVDGDTLIAEAGASLASVCRVAAEAGLSGMEKLYGIPGSVGGAVAMNAGAYGVSVSDLMPETYAVSPQNPNELTFYSTAEQQFSYRMSLFQQNSDVFITSVILHLKAGDKEEIAAKMREIAEERRKKQPLEYPSLGSVFRRPKDGYASKFIEDAGLKGMTYGGAVVSPKHAGFIVNTGGATSEDVMELLNRVRDTVFRKYCVMLEPEIKIVR